MCAGNELWFSMIYMLHFSEGPAGRDEQRNEKLYSNLLVSFSSSQYWRLRAGSLAFYSLPCHTDHGWQADHQFDSFVHSCFGHGGDRRSWTSKQSEEQIISSAAEFSFPKKSPTVYDALLLGIDDNSQVSIPTSYLSVFAWFLFISICFFYLYVRTSLIDGWIS